MKTTRYLLTKNTGRDTTFCAFTTKTDGSVRVVAHGTHTNYVSDFVVTAEEARETWTQKIKDGFKRDLAA